MRKYLMIVVTYPKYYRTNQKINYNVSYNIQKY